MQAAVITLLSLTFIGATVAGPLATGVDDRIFTLLTKANALGSVANPALTAECFSYYLPILNKVSKLFSVAYEQCISTAKESSANLSLSSEIKRNTFTSLSGVFCQAFENCNNDDDNLDFFNCYASAASDDVTRIYSLSSNALDTALNLKSGLQQIQTTEDLCTNDAQSILVTQTDQIYSDLNACFSAGLPITSTAAPESTTKVSSSAAPDSSVAPAETTLADTMRSSSRLASAASAASSLSR